MLMIITQTCNCAQRIRIGNVKFFFSKFYVFQCDVKVLSSSRYSSDNHLTLLKKGGRKGGWILKGAARKIELPFRPPFLFNRQIIVIQKSSYQSTFDIAY